MAKKVVARHLPNIRKATPKVPVIGVFATSDPRIDKDSRTRCQNIAKMAAETISGSVILPDNCPRSGHRGHPPQRKVLIHADLEAHFLFDNDWQ